MDLQSRLGTHLLQREPFYVYTYTFVVLEHERTCLFPRPLAEEVLLEEEDEIAEEKSPLDGAWYKRKQNLPGENAAEYLFSVFNGPSASGSHREE